MAQGSDAAADGFVAYLVDELRLWAPVLARRMFGGFGLFRGAIMFAIVNDDVLYLRTDNGNRPAFEAAGMVPFRYSRSGKLVALGYHQAPADVIEDRETLAEWAQAAYGAALRMAKPAPHRRRALKRRR